MQNSLNDFKSALFAGDFNLAENIGLVQIQQNGEKADWLNEMGLLYLMKGDLTEALRLFDRAIAADNFYIEAQFNAAIILSDLGFYEEASQRFAEACKHEGVLLAQKHYDMAQFYLSMRKLDLAEDELRKAIALYNSSDFYVELTRIYIEQKKFDEAIVEIDTALSLNLNNSVAENLRSQCLQAKDNFLSLNKTVSELNTPPF
ncbi:tetratricopeptide repeat protein [Fluviispira multicolorata]|uniref:Tetratricopeptide repeat protein n=1 Tax=Fluviispira multicolorata TaxID=2654512 RepID=A0A833JEH1_9BACT|nr:tetratricopeptide repeat protein [Fluviispira multicolorata]KAB8033195.1 tetratricopeptide repeat protein [Fluviispira multicolorata]